MPLPPSGTVGVPPDRQQPPFRFYFSVPANGSQGAGSGHIFFAALARLYDPQGKPWPAEEPRKGWVELPADRPGLWSFAAIEPGMVRVRDLPPFFAFNEPQAHFVPAALDWQGEQPAAAPPLPADALYVPGPSGRDTDRALHLSGRKYFQIAPPAGAPPGFIPNTEGTLEFFLRPNWDFFELAEGARKGLVAPGFFVDQTASGISFSWGTDGKIPQAPFGGHRLGPSMLLKDRWTHVAIVWGPTRAAEVIWGQYGAKSITSQTRGKKLDLTVYVNGKRAAQSYINHPIPADGQVFLPLPYLAVGGLGETNRLDAAIDNLRLSTVQRYSEDFAPSARECEFGLDPQTRALFLFNGSLQGTGAGLGEPLIGLVKE